MNLLACDWSTLSAVFRLRERAVMDSCLECRTVISRMIRRPPVTTTTRTATAMPVALDAQPRELTDLPPPANLCILVIVWIEHCVAVHTRTVPKPSSVTVCLLADSCFVCTLDHCVCAQFADPYFEYQLINLCVCFLA